MEIINNHIKKRLRIMDNLLKVLNNLPKMLESRVGYTDNLLVLEEITKTHQQENNEINTKLD